jgi:hypothetical protein
MKPLQGHLDRASILLHHVKSELTEAELCIPSKFLDPDLCSQNAAKPGLWLDDRPIPARIGFP